jgi:hypothetical protein
LLVPDEAPTVIVRSLEEVGGVAAATGHAALAARLLGAAEAARGALDYVRGSVEDDQFQRDVNATRHALGEDGFPAAWSAGVAMSLDDAVQLLCGESFPAI